MTATFAITTLAAFNLICAGTTQKTLTVLPPEGASQYTETFRINLDDGRWCKGGCAETQPIVETSDTEIVLSRLSDNRGQALETINRESGRHSYFIRIENFANSGVPMIRSQKGECQMHPFTGFPARKF